MNKMLSSMTWKLNITRIFLQSVLQYNYVVIMIICTGEKNAALSNSLHDRKAQLFTASARELVKISQNLSKSLINARVSLMLNYIYNNSTVFETRVPHVPVMYCGLNSILSMNYLWTPTILIVSLWIIIDLMYKMYGQLIHHSLKWCLL